ncbi:MAG TPA: nuclease-related domain-containing protein [Actinomycetota bacterium]|nr:nuclease-related domain-containing protein [Actinomycetota bacterium]
MKTEHRDHPLGTPGLSARQMARSLEPSSRVLRFLATLFPGLRGFGSSWEKGAKGEEAVAKKLAELPAERWNAVHDRPLGEGRRNVDHVVVGRGGVFSVNAKNLSGKVVVKRNAFLVNNRADKCLHVARDEAVRVARLLTSATGEPVAVTPVIVVRCAALDIQAQPEGVHVISVHDVPQWFEAHGEVLDAPRVSRIWRSVCRPGLWTSPVPPVVTGDLSTKVWKRYGQDRVYVNDGAGKRLGHLNRKTGEIHVDVAARREDVRAVLAEYVQ